MSQEIARAGQECATTETTESNPTPTLNATEPANVILTTTEKFRQTLSALFREIGENLVIILTFGEIKKKKNEEDIGGSQTKFKRSSFKEHTYHQEVPTFNGLITSIETFVFLMTFIIVILLTPYLRSSTDGVPTKITLIIIMITGICIMVNFSVYKDKYLTVKRKNLGLRGQLVLIGIILFFAMGSFKDLSNSFILFSCLPVYRRCGEIATKLSTISIIFHISRIVYLAMQTAFCIQYRNYQFINKCSSQFGLMILQAANLGTWFDVLLRQSASNMECLHESDYSNLCNFTNSSDLTPPSILNNISNYYFSNQSTISGHDSDCIYVNGTFHMLILRYISPITFPFLFQFSLLALECYVYWFAQCGLSGMIAKVEENGNQTVDHRMTKSNAEPRVMGRGLNIRHTLAHMSSYNPSDVNISTSPTFNFISNSNNHVRQEQDTSQDAMQYDKSISFKSMVKKSFVLIILLNIMFGLFNFAPITVASPEDQILYNTIRDYYCLAYWLLNIFLIFLGFYCTTAFNETQKKKKFRSLNYLLIVSAVGPYVYAITAITTIVKYPEPLKSSNIYLIISKEVVFFVSVLVQIPFCFLAGKVVLPSKRINHTFKVNCLKTITLYFAISNGLLWLVDSFTIYSKEKADIQWRVLEGEKWDFLRNIIFPLSISFRFYSSLLFTAAHVRMTSSYGRTKMFYLE